MRCASDSAAQVSNGKLGAEPAGVLLRRVTAESEAC
jgi:hypothetical protein